MDKKYKNLAYFFSSISPLTQGNSNPMMKNSSKLLQVQSATSPSKPTAFWQFEAEKTTLHSDRTSNLLIRESERRRCWTAPPPIVDIQTRSHKSKQEGRKPLQKQQINPLRRRESDHLCRSFTNRSKKRITTDEWHRSNQIQQTPQSIGRDSSNKLRNQDLGFRFADWNKYFVRNQKISRISLKP